MTSQLTQTTSTARLSSDNASRPFVASLAEALHSGDPESLTQQLSHYREMVNAVETLLSPPDAKLPLELRGGAHSKQYMIELLPHIQRLLATLERGTRLRVLDVGPGVAHGSELLASLYRSPELGYRLDVTAFDIVPTYHYYAEASCRHVRHIVADLDDLDETFDIVTASHVLEHVASPVEFCAQLQAKASLAVFVTAPFAEPPDNLTAGHLHSLDDEFLAAIDADEQYVYESPAWGAMKKPPYKAFIARLPGRVDTIRPPVQAPAPSDSELVPIPKRLIRALDDRQWALERPSFGERGSQGQSTGTNAGVRASGPPLIEVERPVARGHVRVAIRRILTAVATQLGAPRGPALLDLAASLKVLVTGSGKPARER